MQAIILGVVEGVTEFLPVSSTGHLILSAKVLGLKSTEFLKSFDILIQLGAIGAVLALYWRKLLIDLEISKRVLVAFVPTAFVGFLLYKIIKTYLLGNAWVVVITLFLGGLILILFEWYLSYKDREGNFFSVDSLAGISYQQAFLVGLGQSLSVIPGLSRSAATIVSGLALKIKREVIVEFSFLLAVPTMLAASAFDLLKSSAHFSAPDFGLLFIGFWVSFLVAFLAIKTFLAYVKHHNFIAFGVYRLGVALIFAWFFLL